MRHSYLLLVALSLHACRDAGPSGLAPAPAARTTVKYDLYHRPLPEIPLPNDLATRFDADSPTLRRVNASMIAPTGLERRVRRLVDTLDGWGPFQSITIPFTGPLDVQSILEAHRDADYDLRDDVLYLVNIDPRSAHYGQVHPLDVGNGNYPVVLERRQYWRNDPREDSMSLVFEEGDEDLDRDGVLDLEEDDNGNGRLDPGEDLDLDGRLDVFEDTDADGLLDRPNYLPGHRPARDDLAGRADALMSFYESQTNTLLVRPLVPLDETTTYAVVITRRLRDVDGLPVGSPFPFINHTAQSAALTHLVPVLPEGLTLEDVAFTFSFTTQSISKDWIAVRDGLYGHGVQAQLSREFSADVAELEPLRDKAVFTDATNPYLLYTENWLEVVGDVAEQFGLDTDTIQFRTMLESQRYVDYHVVGSFDSPQLFQRKDELGQPLPYDEQSWPADLERRPVEARRERVYFWLTVPRKEVSARGQGQPAPLVIASHGYTSSRLEMLFYAGEFARHGLATIAIDCVSHGIGLHPLQRAVIEGTAKNAGLEPFARAAFKDRAFDQNGDERPDSGADFWTAYLFHTRDVVRQSALDYMQLVRVVRAFDGQRRFGFDLNGDGQPELAGDFDGDGAVDVGGQAKLGITGGSLGGIMSMVLGAMEPELLVSVPIAGGGGMSDIGIRSLQGGVREAVGLRLMAPVILGTLEGGDLKLEALMPDLNDAAERTIGRLPGAAPGEVLLVQNENNGERGCGIISPAGTVRAGVQADLGDRLTIHLYPRGALAGGEHCELRPGRAPRVSLAEFGEEVIFQERRYPAGSPLVTLAEGLGLPRAHPRLRRFLSLSQLVLDPADPAVIARYMQREPLTYPGTGQTTGTHVMVVTTVGDMNVPANSGVTTARAAGLIEYREPDRRYGKPLNQVLIDTYTAEAVNVLERFVNRAGAGVHLDVENFSQGTDMWGDDVPRLEKPLRIGLDRPDPLGGISGAIFPYAVPEGQHGFAFPGEDQDTVQRRCQRACADPAGCGCASLRTFDVGHFMFNMLGRYFASGGQRVDTDLCNARDDCPGMAPPPAPRAPAELR